MRPIDADELEKSLENYSNNHGLINAFVEFLNVVDELPTLDVKPVVQGEWIDTNEWRETVDGFEQWGWFRKCSKCGYVFKFLEIDNYCPNCGAKMKNEE